MTEVVWTVRTQTFRTAPKTARALTTCLNRRVLLLDMLAVAALTRALINGAEDTRQKKTGIYRRDCWDVADSLATLPVK